MKAHIAFFTAFILCGCGGSWDQEPGISDRSGLGKADDTTEPTIPEDQLWIQDLPVTERAQLEAALPAVENMTFATADGRDLQIPWGYIEHDCYRRADMILFGLAVHASDRPVHAPLELDAQTVAAITDNPTFAAAKIHVAAPLHFRSNYIAADGSALSEPTVGGWTDHKAVVVPTEKGLRVLDFALSHEPLTIQEWLAGYLPAGTACAHASQDELSRVVTYYNMKVQIGYVEPPPHTCVYALERPFDRGVVPALDEARDLLAGDLSTMQHALANHQLALEQLYQVRRRVVPLTREQYCENNASKVCVVPPVFQLGQIAPSSDGRTVADHFRLEVAAGDDIRVFVDAFSTMLAFDPTVTAITESDAVNGVKEDVQCMSGFRVCPELTTTAAQAGALDIYVVNVGKLGLWDGPMPYALVVSVNGKYVSAPLVEDDVERP